MSEENTEVNLSEQPQMSDEMKAALTAVFDVAYCLAEIGLSKEVINAAFQHRADTDPYFVDAWQSAYRDNGSDYWFNVMYSRLPDKPGEGQMKYVPRDDEGAGTE